MVLLSWPALAAGLVVPRALRGAAAQDLDLNVTTTADDDPAIAPEDANLSYDEADMIFKANTLNWSEVNIRPGRCDAFDQYCLDIPRREGLDGWSTSADLVARFREQYLHFSDAWMSVLERDIEANFERYEASRHVGIGTEGSIADISVVSIGLVVDNVYGISYLNNKFTADVRIYMREIVQETPLASVREAFDDAFGATRVAAFKHAEDEDKSYVELLEDKWEDARTSDSRYDDADPVPHAFCSRKYHNKMRLMKVDDYQTRFGGGIQIAHATSSPSNIQDEEGNLLYAKASGVTVSFDPPNGKFYPFQSNVMDMKLLFPRGRDMNRVILCVDPHYTALNLPMESIRRRNPDTPYLKLIPRIIATRAPPFLGNNFLHMQNSYEEWQRGMLTEGNKVVHSAAFTILFIPDYLDGFADLYPFLFIIFTIELQWLVNFPDNFSAAQMISAILQIQTITNAQGNYLNFDNKITQVIYLTYGIALTHIVTIALMAFININKEKGSLPRLVRWRGTIFRMLRLITVLLAFFLIPILVMHTDANTGQQWDYPSLYYVVGFGSIGIMGIFGFREWRGARKFKRELQSEEECTLSLKKSFLPDSSWTAEEVGQWIGSSEALRDVSSLTEGELEAVADKFVKAGVNGVVFPLVAYDTTSLKQDVGVTVGEAVLFAHSMEKMRVAVSDIESDGIETASALQSSPFTTSPECTKE